MELRKDFYFIAIIAILLVGLTPLGDNLVNTSGSTEKGILSSIDKNAAGINSDTEGISNLLSSADFNNEDFAQETTLSELAGTDFARETTLADLNKSFGNEDFAQENTLSTINQNLEDSFGLFDGLDVNNRQTLFHIEPTVPLNERRNEWTGNVSWTGSTYKITGTGSLRSEQRGEYQPGSTGQIGQMIRIPEPPSTGSEDMEWLYFNDDNGFYFGVNTTCTYVELERDNEVIKSFCQKDWNVNTVNTTEETSYNPSGRKLDLNDANMYQGEYSWYGGGIIQMDIIFDSPEYG